MSFCHSRTVRFGDIDAAGIVYYPRLLHYCHIAFEEFFGEVSAQPYSQWIEGEQLGFPTRKLHCEFLHPVTYGSTIDVEVRIAAIGDSSVDFRFCGAVRGEEPSFEVKALKVCIDLDSRRPMPIPPELKTLFASHLEEA